MNGEWRIVIIKAAQKDKEKIKQLPALRQKVDHFAKESVPKSAAVRAVKRKFECVLFEAHKRAASVGLFG